jgi:hypothetical protein
MYKYKGTAELKKKHTIQNEIRVHAVLIPY